MAGKHAGNPESWDVEALLSTTEVAKRASAVDLDKKVRMAGQCCWDASRGLINPVWVA